MNEPDSLARIRRLYGSILISVAAQFGHRSEVMAGILQRETAGGTSRWLVDVYHTPNDPCDDVGDGGHGHGLFQIDDRWHPEFCAGEDWKDCFKNAAYAAKTLRESRDLILAICEKFHVPVAGALLERMTIAGYNCPPDKVVHALRAGEDLDTYTTGRDYSRDVLRLAESYLISSEVL